MSFSSIFHAVFYQPILNVLIGTYAFIPDAGVAIVIVTVIIKLVLWPFTEKSLKSQTAMKAMQPELEALKAKYKDDKTALAKETMELYKRHGTSPTGSCVALLLQLPFIFALFRVFQDGLKQINPSDIYSFVPFSGNFNTVSLGFFDLTSPNWALALLAAGAQFWQSYQMMKMMPSPVAKDGQPDVASIMNKQMTYVFPAVTFFIGLQFPSGLAMYWLVSTLMAILQQTLFLRRSPKMTSVVDAVSVEKK